MNKIRVALIEDEDDIRESLFELLCGDDRIAMQEAFGDAESAMPWILGNAVDVVLFDVQLPGMSGVEAIEKLKVLKPEVQFLILSAYDDAERIFNALRAGATGYLLKNTPPQKIIASILEVHAGGSPMSSEIARKVVTEFSRTQEAQLHHEALTNRENEILGLLAKGLRYKEIAGKSFISIDTVRTHIRNIYLKLHVNSRWEAIKAARG